jgi:hypothetical protein
MKEFIMPNRIGQTSNVSQLNQSANVTNQNNAQTLGNALGQLQTNQNDANTLGNTLKNQVGVNAKTLNSTFGQEGVLNVVSTLAEATQGSASGGSTPGGGDVIAPVS